jgi:hypothetical protein
VGDTIWLRWRAANYPTSCVAAAVPADTRFSTGEGKEVRGTDTTVTEPAVGTATTYSVRCRNESGAHTDSLTVSKYPAPVTSLYFTNTTKNTPETQSNSTIAATDSFKLRWIAVNNPASCTASASPADSSFSTGGEVSGTDSSITGPSAGSARNYTVTCQNRSGSSADSLWVTRATPRVCVLDGVTVPSGSSRTFFTNPTVPYGSTCTSITRTCTDGTLSGSSSYDESSCSVGQPGSCSLDGVNVSHGSSRTFYMDETVPFGSSCQSTTRTCTNGVLSGSTSYDQTGCVVSTRDPLTSDDLSITADPSTVRYGESSTITWTSRNADSCTVTGPNLNATTLNDSETVSDITSESVYTLRCSQGGTTHEKSVTVKVLPSSQET